MSKERIIRVIGEINEDSYKEFSEQLYNYEALSDKPVVLELSSGGGTAYDALAFVGRMRNSPCDIIIRGYGYIASAAVIILAAGDVRYLTLESWVMVHEDTIKIKGDVVTLEREVTHLRAMETQWSMLLTDMTTTSFQVWDKLHKDTTYLSADRCLQLGLVDKLI